MADRTKTVSEVAEVLDMSRAWVEQAISRKHFLPSIHSEPGKAREWTLDEVIRLAVFVRLVDMADMDPRDAGILTQIGFHGFKDDAAFFVAYKGDPRKHPTIAWSGEHVKARDLGEFLTSKCNHPKVLNAGRDESTIRENSKPNYGPAHVAVIVNLDEIEADVKSKW